MSRVLEKAAELAVAIEESEELKKFEKLLAFYIFL